MPYTGSHKRIMAYDSITEDGRQFFRTYEKFDASTFVAYIREMWHRFGKVTVTTGRSPQHRAKIVRKFLQSNKDVKIIHPAKGSPYLNAMEETWCQGKQDLLVSE